MSIKPSIWSLQTLVQSKPSSQVQLTERSSAEYLPIRMTEELPASKLGTKEHWDMVYERETKEYEVRSLCKLPG
jgi:hypothetical protein